MNLLAWIGRQRTRGVAVVMLIGIAVPPLGDLLRPYLTVAVIGLLAIAFLRLEPAALRRHLGRPALVLTGLVWTSLAVPLVLIGLGWALGLREAHPDLYLALMLQAVASPLMSAPAYAALLGLEATLVLAALVLGSLALPVTAATFVAAMDLPLTLEPALLGLKLAGILGVAATLGIGLRRLLGPALIARRRDEIDGVNILIMLVFAAAVMGDVAETALAEPATALGLTVLAFAVFGGLLALTALVFAPLGGSTALSLGLMASLRNLAVMIAATGGAVPETVWLYLAFSQFPIYLGPWLIQPLARRALLRR